MADLSGIVKAYDIRGVVGEQLGTALVREFGAAFALLIKPDSPSGSDAASAGVSASAGSDAASAGVSASAVVIGHDMRDSSPELAAAFADGVTSQGLDVVSIGLASTDEVYFASGSLHIPGAMFTASHNPAKYNGIKLCRAGAAPVGQETGLAEVRETVEQGVPAFNGRPGRVTERDVLAEYTAYLRKLVDLSTSRPLKIVVDAGNGMGGHTVPTVFDGLPFEIVPMYFELDGRFPNHDANPLDPANIVDLQAKVREVGADAGVAFDGDADRCFIVDERGEPVSPSTITALVAVRELAKEPGGTIIHNLITSHGVPEIVAEHGGKPVRARVGHSFIKAEMASTGAIFGGEHSAHYYFRDFWRADTGMLAAMHVLAALGEQDGPLSALTAEYSRYAASGEINSTVGDQVARLLAVKDDFGPRPGVTVDELDGLTVQLPGGAWFNLRPSNTEPLLRLNVEAADADAVKALTDEVLAIVRG